ncbi:hypothetical protein [Fodinicola feengrottensis]|uniref:hypothetical protein n=1 Tax=Fodinicola feengrottensis TaxID=435914 RepID=UPI0013D66BB5|nr:hypothetical protein [Fodinicola feengrottensis]
MDHLIRNIDQVLDQRDQVRGVTDHRGISGPVWRAATQYNAARATLMDKNGNPLLDVRTAQRAVNNLASIEVVHNGETDTSPFTLIFRDKTNAATTFSNVNFDTGSANYVFKVIYNQYNDNTRISVRDVRPSHATAVGLPVAAKTTLQPANYVYPVHTGQICHPIASFVRIVNADPTLKANTQYKAKADSYLAAVQAAVAFHDYEYWVNADGFGAYQWLKETPVPADGSNMPLNQCNTLGSTYAELYRITGSSAYALRMKQLKLCFRSAMTQVGTGSSIRYYWPYWGPRAAAYNGWTATGFTAKDISSFTQTKPAEKQIEDISHAALNLEFAIDTFRTGLPAPDSAFSLADMQRLANTYLLYIKSGATTAHLNINGTGTAGAGFIDQIPRWIGIAEWNPAVYTHALAVTQAQAFQPDQGSHVLGFAYCVYGTIKFGKSS